MAERRLALIVASYQYKDPELRQLMAPAQDAEALARVLGDPAIGNFEVQTLLNEPSYQVGPIIETFFADRKRDDLLLLYFSGHGVKDPEGRLYFATVNTSYRMLRTTAIPATLVNDVMRYSRSRRQVLLLDCCYSGAFATGMVTKADSAIGTGERFEGRGRVVLTASDAMQYAFEGGEITGEGVRSVFTRTLVDGLETGKADLDGSGLISLDELYEYVHDRVTDETPQQRPGKWAFDVQGQIIIARNPRPVAGPRKVPSEEPEARNVRHMLDQKRYNYETHQLLLEPRELEIVAAQLNGPSLELNDADKRLLLYSAVAHGRGARWMALAGESGALWLRQACQDNTCPAMVRRGAAASLGAADDRAALEQLSQAVQESTSASKGEALDLLAEYLHRSTGEIELPRPVHWGVFPRLVRLRVRGGTGERRRMKRVAMVAALVGVIALYSAYIAFGDLGEIISLDNLVFSLISLLVFLLLSQIFAYAFAELITCLEMILQRQSPGWRALILSGAGITVGAPLFLTMTATSITWFEGGLIGFALGALHAWPEPRPPAVRWALSVLAGVAAAAITLLIPTQAKVESATAATIVAGFVTVYLLFRSYRL
jgi:hypothetical protein